MPTDPTTVSKLAELMTAIRAYPDPRRAADEWRQAFKLLQKSGLPADRVTHVVGMRDLAGLSAFIEQLRAPQAAAPPPAAGPDAETCRRALRAFRKRQSLTRLDDESKISSHSPLTKGSAKEATAIVPPNEYPPEVWQELVRQGKLRYIGHGLYELGQP
jgi:hypothetical protein